MNKLIVIVSIIAIFLTATDAASAGLGKPLPGETKDEALESLKNSDAYRHALSALKEKGLTEEQAGVALEKMPRSQLEMLGAQADGVRSGGLLDFLLFVLFVALVVYLIILLIDAAEHRHYRY